MLRSAISTHVKSILMEEVALDHIPIDLLFLQQKTACSANFYRTSPQEAFWVEPQHPLSNRSRSLKDLVKIFLLLLCPSSMNTGVFYSKTVEYMVTIPLEGWNLNITVVCFKHTSRTCPCSLLSKMPVFL